MLPIAIHALRDALRSPSPWLATIVGVFTVWAGLSLNVLAVDSRDAKSIELGLATIEMTCCFLAIWLTTRLQRQDSEEGGLESGLLAAGPGRVGLIGGTWVGAILGSMSPILPMSLMIVVYHHMPGGDGYSMLYTIISSVPMLILELGCLVAWMGVLLPAAGGPVTLIVGLALLVAARAGPGGALAGLLPVPVPSPGSSASAALLLAEAATIAGLALLALSGVGRARAT